MKPQLKPPGTKCLQLQFVDSLSSFGFKFNLRRFNVAGGMASFIFPEVGRCRPTTG